VKDNQKSMKKLIEEKTVGAAASEYTETDTKRGRIETRDVFLYERIENTDWKDVKWFVRVARTVVSKGKTRTETAYYISNATQDSAEYFAEHIRSHWGIENRLHWVKDVIMNEDTSGIKNMTAAGNISLLRNIAINVYRSNNFKSIKYATEEFAHDIQKLLALLAIPMELI
jgi:predicted transposase YbfD/YdcC